MNVLLVLPLLIPLVAAAAGILVSRWAHVQRWLALVGSLGLFASSVALLASVWTNGIQVSQMGGWPAPVGITLVADLLSAVMVLLAGIIGLAATVYSFATIDPERQAHGYYPLLHILLMGVCGAFLTGDVFNLYVWFEVLLIASFVLLTLGGERGQTEGAIKYVTLNLVSSAFFLAAVGILYGTLGTLNMADLAVKVRALDDPAVVTTISMMFLVAFGIKAAAFPLFFWLPASYHTPPVAVSAVFAGLLTKVGVYALIRVFTLVFVQEVHFTHTILLVIAGLTMITGVLGAVAQMDFRRLLSFQIVSAVGYMLMGLALFTPLALTGSIFYIVQDAIVKTNLFLISGVVHRIHGTYDLKKLGGLYRTHSGIALLFLVPALSLAGIPPFSGFFGKLVLVQAGLQVEQFLIVAVALVVSLLTLFCMFKIWTEAFWKPLPENSELGPDSTTDRAPASISAHDHHPLRGLVMPVAGLAAITVFIGLLAEPVMVLSNTAAAQLLDPTGYVDAIMGEAR